MNSFYLELFILWLKNPVHCRGDCRLFPVLATLWGINNGRKKFLMTLLSALTGIAGNNSHIALISCYVYRISLHNLIKNTRCQEYISKNSSHDPVGRSIARHDPDEVIPALHHRHLVMQGPDRIYLFFLPDTKNAAPAVMMAMTAGTGVSGVGVVTDPPTGVRAGVAAVVALTTGTVVIVVVGTAVGRAVTAGTAVGAATCAGVPSVMLTSWAGAAGFWATIA